MPYIPGSLSQKTTSFGAKYVPGSIHKRKSDEYFSIARGPKVTPTPPKPSILESISRIGGSFAGGVSGVLADLSSMAEWAGVETAEPYTRKFQKWTEKVTPKDQSYIEKVYAGAGSMTLFYAPGFGVTKVASVIGKFSPTMAKIVGGSTMALLESGTEAGSVWKANMDMGKSDAESNDKATKTFWANTALNSITNRLGIFGDSKTALKKILLSSSMEGFQEYGQTVISNVNTDRPWDEGAMEAGSIGFLLGGAFGINSIVPDAISVKKVEDKLGLSEDQAKEFVREVKKMQASKSKEPVAKGQEILNILRERTPETGTVDTGTALTSSQRMKGILTGQIKIEPRPKTDLDLTIPKAEVKTETQPLEVIPEIKSDPYKAKGKTLEEFLKERGQIFYRGEGGNSSFSTEELLGKGKYIIDRKDIAEKFGDVTEYVLPNNIKLFKEKFTSKQEFNRFLNAVSKYDKEFADVLKKEAGSGVGVSYENLIYHTSLYEQETRLKNVITSALKDAGYDGIQSGMGNIAGTFEDFSRYGMTSKDSQKFKNTVLFPSGESKLQTKSELTNIWKKENPKTPLPLKKKSENGIPDEVKPKEITTEEEKPQTKTRGLAIGVEAKAIANQLTKSFGDLPKYETVNFERQGELAAELVENNYELALDVAMGNENAPSGILPEAIFTAVENKALKNGDVNTLRDLATTSKILTEATTMGQRISYLQERYKESPVDSIKDIIAARELAYGENVKSEKKKIAKKIKESIDEVNKKKKPWLDFVNSLKC